MHIRKIYGKKNRKKTNKNQSAVLKAIQVQAENSPSHPACESLDIWIQIVL